MHSCIEFEKGKEIKLFEQNYCYTSIDRSKHNKSVIHADTAYFFFRNGAVSVAT